MNKRYLAISIFLIVLAIYSFTQIILQGAGLTTVSLFLVFAFLAILFLRQAKR